MLPTPRLFRSRWAALLWAGGVLWAAADIARSAPHEGKQAPAGHGTAEATDADEASVNAADLDALANTLNL